MISSRKGFDYRGLYRVEVLKFYVKHFGVTGDCANRTKRVTDRCISFGEFGGFKYGSVMAAFVYQDLKDLNGSWVPPCLRSPEFSQRNIAAYFGTTEVSIRNILKKWKRQQDELARKEYAERLSKYEEVINNG